ncbi:hypothetical protein MLD38_018336 [Melastoma candidum]|uniref:Uncharacterized protein n=1 Tax=Melastoma candidum TaxID=119954 RepID=A0ACB9QTG4_9MYRT|nr:hypothetical protein MLD38_018336 [Melastoma candidum]
MTIRVVGLPSGITAAEVENFFWFCGNIVKVRLEREEDCSMSATVTFTEPFAFRTALLLDEAVLCGQSVRVLPLMETKDDGDGGRSEIHIQATRSMRKGYSRNLNDGIVRLIIGEVRTLITANPYVVPTLIFISGLLYRIVITRYRPS